MDDEGVSAPKYVAVSKDRYGAKAVFCNVLCEWDEVKGKGGGVTKRLFELYF